MDRGRRGAPRNRVIGAAPPPGPNRVTAARGAAPCGHRVWGGTAAGWGLGGMGGTSRAGGTLTVTYPVCVCAHPDTHTHTHTHTPRHTHSTRAAGSPGRPGRNGGTHGIGGAPQFHPTDRRAGRHTGAVSSVPGHTPRPGSVDSPVPWGRRRGAVLGGTPIRAPLCPPPRVPLWGEGHFHAVPCSGDRRFPPARSRFPSEGLLRPPPHCRARPCPPAPLPPALTTPDRMERMELRRGGGADSWSRGHSEPRAAIPGACYGTWGGPGPSPPAGPNAGPGGRKRGCARGPPGGAHPWAHGDGGRTGGRHGGLPSESRGDVPGATFEPLRHRFRVAPRAAVPPPPPPRLSWLRLLGNFKVGFV